MNAPISGQWHPTTNKWRDESQMIHFVKQGDSAAMCGRGRPGFTNSRQTTLAGPVEPAGRQRCQTCVNHANAEARRRKATARRFCELIDKLDPAERQQMGQAWPAHAREDDTADWWMTHAPHYINDMRDVLRRNK